MSAFGGGFGFFNNGDSGDGGTNIKFYQITYAAAEALIAASTLKPGSFYEITNKAIVLQAIRTNAFSLQGSYLARVPDYDNSVGAVYTGIVAYTTVAYTGWIGDWTGNVAVGKVVIYNNTHYQKINSTVTAAVPAANANYTELPITNANYLLFGYLNEEMSCLYDFSRDSILKLIDKRLNEIDNYL